MWIKLKDHIINLDNIIDIKPGSSVQGGQYWLRLVTVRQSTDIELECKNKQELTDLINEIKTKLIIE